MSFSQYLRDADGASVEVCIMPYRIRMDGYQSLICIRDVDDRLIPLTAQQARLFAKALKKAAKELEGR